MYYRRTADDKCDCKLLYQGDEDYLLRIGGSCEEKNKTKSVTLISYGLLIDFTLDFMENGKTITGFHKLYVAKCKRKYGMKNEDIISLTAWKTAVSMFWRDLIDLDTNMTFTCNSCGNQVTCCPKL